MVVVEFESVNLSCWLDLVASEVSEGAFAAQALGMEGCSESEGSEITARSLSPSPVPSESSLSAGRPRKSPVWDYFIYDSNVDKSVCQVRVEDSNSAGATSSLSPSTKFCGRSIAKKYPSNLRSHLKNAHSLEYKELLKKEERTKREKAEKAKMAVRKATGPVRTQTTLGEVFQRKYDRGNRRYQSITQKLAVFVGSTNVPNSIVESAEFRSLLEELDPRYLVPGRTLISKEIDKVLFDLKLKIQGYLSNAQKVNLCADIWTKKGMSSSYLGVTAHFFSQRDHRRHRVTLAVKRMSHPHNAESIRELIDEVLKEWSIPLSQVGAVITDNGSNMVKAFQQQCFANGEDEEDAEEEDESDSWKEFDETESDTITDDEEDFVAREFEHDMAFKFFGKRLSCFAHTLQLVVLKFNKELSCKEVLKKVCALVKKVKKSSKATEKLLSLCHKKLVGNCPTRWSSTYLMIERLLEVRVPLTKVLEELEWDNLATSEWKTLENMHLLLKPFAQYTSLVSGEEYTTISSVIPIVMEINLHLEEMKKIPELSAVSTLLQSELK